MNRRFLSIVALNLALLVILLVILELGFGGWFDDPELAWLNVKAHARRVEFDHPAYPDGYPFVYERDEYGLRGPYDRIEEIDVLAIGGSTTNDRDVSEGETWVDVLQQQLRLDGAQVTVANAGLDGHSTIGHINSLKRWLPYVPELHPRIVLFYVGINDRGVVEGQVPESDELEYSTASRRIREYIKHNSAVYTLARRLRGWSAARRIGVHYGRVDLRSNSPDWVAALPTALPPERWDRRLHSYSQRIRKIAALARAWDAEPIFITQVNGDARVVAGVLEEVAGSRGAALRHELDLFNARLLETCRDTGDICIDLAGELEFKEGDFYDSIHTTPSGSRRIGEFLARKLRPLLP